MRRIIKFIGFFLLILSIVVLGNYAYAVIEARAYTQKIIVKDLQRSEWRRLDGKPQAIRIRSGDLSARQKEILIKVQDPGFYHHSGVDLSTPGAGLTTITQAIVKKLYFKKFVPGTAKIRQTVIARFVVDDLISKEDQLTLFLNTMFFGRVNGKPSVGLVSAAEAYYQQTVHNLTEDQYISLIAMIVMPGTFHIIEHPDWNRDRVNRIKALMEGRYRPNGLMDQFYGDLPKEVVNAGLPPASYFKDSK